MLFLGETAESTFRQVDVGMIFDNGPFGGHHLGGDLCPPITFDVVPH